MCFVCLSSSGGGLLGCVGKGLFVGEPVADIVGGGGLCRQAGHVLVDGGCYQSACLAALIIRGGSL